MGVRRFDFDAGMAPYDLASYNGWLALAGHIRPADLERLRPAGGAVLCITAEADPVRQSLDAAQRQKPSKPGRHLLLA